MINEQIYSKVEHYKNMYNKDDNLFPHIVIDNFLNNNVVEQVEEEMSQEMHWVSDDHNHSQKKQSMQIIGQMPPMVKSVCYFLNSKPFVDFLCYVTGHKNVIVDESLNGGGMHRTLRGGFLNVHHDYTDFDKFHDQWYNPNSKPKILGRGLYRHLNLLIYINDEWKSEWGGDLEFWSPDLKQKIKEVKFEKNKAILFGIDGVPHGYQKPLECPEDTFRKSLAFYYYTTQPTINSYDRAHWKVGEELK